LEDTKMQTVTGATAEVTDLDGLGQKIERWRNQKPRTRAMPEELWEQASEAARSFGVGRVSKALKLGYATLCRRSGAEGVRGKPGRRDRMTPAASGEFVELSGFASVRAMASGDGAVVEVAAPDGTRLTIRLKEPTNVVALVNALRWRG
jgi:hypothetical protein